MCVTGHKGDRLLCVCFCLWACYACVSEIGECVHERKCEAAVPGKLKGLEICGVRGCDLYALPQKHSQWPLWTFLAWGQWISMHLVTQYLACACSAVSDSL